MPSSNANSDLAAQARAAAVLAGLSDGTLERLLVGADESRAALIVDEIWRRALGGTAAADDRAMVAAGNTRTPVPALSGGADGGAAVAAEVASGGGGRGGLIDEAGQPGNGLDQDALVPNNAGGTPAPSAVGGGTIVNAGDNGGDGRGGMTANANATSGAPSPSAGGGGGVTIAATGRKGGGTGAAVLNEPAPPGPPPGVLDFGAECARHRGSLDEQLAAFRQRSEAGDQRHRADMARLYENMARLRGGGNVGALRREEEDLRQRYEAALERLERLLGVDGTGEDESDDDLIGEDVDGVLV